MGKLWARLQHTAESIYVKNNKKTRYELVKATNQSIRLHAASLIYYLLSGVVFKCFTWELCDQLKYDKLKNEHMHIMYNYKINQSQSVKISQNDVKMPERKCFDLFFLSPADHFHVGVVPFHSERRHCAHNNSSDY